MWIVRLALSRPYTFVVMALLLLILGPLSILKTPVDIFPNIGVPVIGVVWGYGGLPPEEIAGRIVSNYERALTTTVNDIEHIESQSLNGVGVVKIFFHPNVNVNLALGQVTAISQTVLRAFPPGATPPLILLYNASSVPVLQLALSSDSLSEQQLYDIGNNFIRTQLATVQGAAVPFPYGGKTRQIQVDLDTHKLQAHGVLPAEVQNAVNNQNLILPSGTEKIGPYEYNIKLNASPGTVEELNELPVKLVNGSLLKIRDLGHVRDGFSPQTSVVRADGLRSVLMTIQKTGNASTLDIIRRVKALLPSIKNQSPPELNLKLLNDQSLFVTAAIEGVIKEGVIAAALTGLMILLFLGSWRSTLIITVSIPLSILASLICLAAIGETINLMTLGGLALAVGILVDDATVAIENINAHLETGKEVKEAILEGAEQIAVPALVATLCICIVFVPMFMLSGVAKYLFVPLAEAVVFAMLASYILSRTLVPTLANYLLSKHEKNAPHRAPHFFEKLQEQFEQGFHKLRSQYRALLQATLKRPKNAMFGFAAFIAFTCFLIPFLGEDFFPNVDGGQIKLHLRAHTGTRVEETARLCDEVEAAIRAIIPADQLSNIVDTIGLPVSGINLVYSNSGPIGSADADVLISLKQGHAPSADFIRAMREKLPQLFPGTQFAFLPADMVAQILNFGLPAPIDVQIIGNDLAGNRAYATTLLNRMKTMRGIADLRMQQAFDTPELNVTLDRSRAEQLGLTTRDIANNVLSSLVGNAQTAPVFWLNKKNGVQYSVITQTPQYRIDTLQDLANVPVTGPHKDNADGQSLQILGGVADIQRGAGAAVVSHYNVANVLDLYATVQDTDLNSVATEITKQIAETKSDVPRGSQIVVRGQVETMQASFTGLFGGMALAVVFVYLLIVVNFQSWTDPFIIITALPAALAGVIWMLFLTHTTLSVPALTGSIMCLGVATANSILVISFARELLQKGTNPMQAALEAGVGRFRPVLMTALAMMIGMVPMALGFGEGGEQNAPLGRAVIGGLCFATLATLFFVPSVFVDLYAKRAAKKATQIIGEMP